MDLQRQTLRDNGRIIPWLELVRDLLATPAMERLAIAISHGQQFAIDNVVADGRSAGVVGIVRARVADDRRDLFHLRHTPGRPYIRSRG
jgi:hypothetical protein